MFTDDDAPFTYVREGMFVGEDFDTTYIALARSTKSEVTGIVVYSWSPSFGPLLSPCAIGTYHEPSKEVECVLPIGNFQKSGMFHIAPGESTLSYRIAPHTSSLPYAVKGKGLYWQGDGASTVFPHRINGPKFLKTLEKRVKALSET